MAPRPLFPTYVYYERLKPRGIQELNADLRDEAYRLRDYDRRGRRWCESNYLGGYTSYGTIANLHRSSSVFESLELQLRTHVKRFARQLEWDLCGKELRLSNIWVNIMPGATVHSSHLHPLSAISGTYYVQAPKGAASIKFEDPRLDRFMGSPPRRERCRPENRPFVSFPPRPGHVVLFESWLRHEVPASKAREDRISVSFNYDWC